jgi:surface carbohydrate biosynthesis protein
MNLKLIIKKISLIVNSKWLFKKPEEKPILIIDGINNPFHFYYNTKQYNIFYRRFEEINFYIVYKCIINFNISAQNYLKNLIKYAKPKILITSIDNNPSFYQYSQYFAVKTAFVQYGNRTYYKDVFSDKSINNKKNKSKFFVDYMFVFNKKIGEIYKNFIKGNIIEIGSFRNNLKKYTNKKKKEVLFISGFRGKNLNDYYENNPKNIFYKNDKNLIKWLYNESKKKNLKFNILGKSAEYYDDEKQFYMKFLGTKKINFFINSHKRNTYKILSNYKYVFAIESTLAIENLANNGRTGFFFNRPNIFPIKSRSFGYMEKLKPNGKFWMTGCSERKFSKVFNFVINSKNKDWNNATKKIKKLVLPVDLGNKKFLNVMNSIIKIK